MVIVLYVLFNFCESNSNQGLKQLCRRQSGCGVGGKRRERSPDDYQTPYHSQFDELQGCLLIVLEKKTIKNFCREEADKKCEEETLIGGIDSPLKVAVTMQLSIQR